MITARCSTSADNCRKIWPVEAIKLLALLAETPLLAKPDSSISAARFILYRSKNGVSISRGSYLEASIDFLASEGCVEWLKSAGTLKITEPGLAHLRRLAAQKSGTSLLNVSAFAAQHKSLKVEEKKSENLEEAGTLHLRDDHESPLSWLAKRKNKLGVALISLMQFQAGERLRADLTIAAMLPRTGANWDAVGGGQGGASLLNPTDMMLAARQRSQKALAAVGPELSGILMDLCGFLKGLEQIEAERNWPPRSAKVVLGMALNCLAAHYGMSEQARGPKFVKSRQWGTKDYRPRITPRQPASPKPDGHPL